MEKENCAIYIISIFITLSKINDKQYIRVFLIKC